LRGPLVKYFFAVTSPVMGNDTPSLQSFPDIVKRQKSFYDWLDRWLEQGGHDRADLASARLLGKTDQSATPDRA
jgi:hypothetical protein